MPALTINAVGFCPHYSDPGDWAFDYALRLSRLHQIQLNVLQFLKDPYDPADNLADLLNDQERAQLATVRERELRHYYDSRAGDYLEVGFRLCEHTEWLELHRCLVAREFQVLVLGYVHEGGNFWPPPDRGICRGLHLPGRPGGPRTAEPVPAEQPGAPDRGQTGARLRSLGAPRAVANLTLECTLHLEDNSTYLPRRKRASATPAARRRCSSWKRKLSSAVSYSTVLCDGVFTVNRNCMITSFNKAAERITVSHSREPLADTVLRFSVPICATGNAPEGNPQDRSSRCRMPGSTS